MRAAIASPPPLRRAGLAALGGAAVLAVALVAGAARSDAAPLADSTLVIDTSFVVRSVDPQREFEPTSSIVDKACYDTLVTFKGSGTTPVPWLAKSFKANANATVFTFKLRSGVQFSDGRPLTSRDVVF